MSLLAFVPETDIPDFKIASQPCFVHIHQEFHLSVVVFYNNNNNNNTLFHLKV